MNQTQYRWLTIILVGFLIFNLGAWTAPLLMKAGYTRAGNLVYLLYAPLCHQMAQRSFFLFGDKIMYAPEELPIPLTGTSKDTLLTRQFKGNETLGWKVAWSDRMVYMYGGMWLALLMVTLLSSKRQIKPISIWWVGIIVLPMAIDGITHFLSDIDGLFAGFRYSNEWLAALTGHIFPASFYQGDALGSFNSWMRLISGLIFGFGVIWFTVPYILYSLDEGARSHRSSPVESL